jgi:hypothetical protein
MGSGWLADPPEDVNPDTEIVIMDIQPCPACGFPMPAVAGSKRAVCRNCGYKEPCCLWGGYNPACGSGTCESEK